MSIEAMKLALEVLERLHGGCTDSDDGTVEVITVWCPEVIDDLRAAIEQAEKQEPVAWLYPEGLAALKAGKCWTAYGTKQDDNNVPIYDAVAPRVEPRASESGAGFESLPASPNQPPPEPVAYIHRQGNHFEVSERHLDEDEKARGWTEEHLYTAPQPRQWKALTYDEIESITAEDCYWAHHTSTDFARAIEAKLKEKNT